MKKNNLPKILKKITIILIILIIILIIISFPVLLNNRYINIQIKEFENNTNLDINYLNTYNNYYIVKTNTEILVYNHNYEEIYKEPLDKIFDLNYDIIYKSNALKYEQTIVSKKKITYNYYDIHTGEKTDNIEIEE